MNINELQAKIQAINKEINELENQRELIKDSNKSEVLKYRLQVLTESKIKLKEKEKELLKNQLKFNFNKND